MSCIMSLSGVNWYYRRDACHTVDATEFRITFSPGNYLYVSVSQVCPGAQYCSHSPVLVPSHLQFPGSCWAEVHKLPQGKCIQMSLCQYRYCVTCSHQDHSNSNSCSSQSLVKACFRIISCIDTHFCSQWGLLQPNGQF